MVRGDMFYQEDIDQERFAWFADVSDEEEESRSSAASIEAGPYQHGDLHVSDEEFEKMLTRWLLKMNVEENNDDDGDFETNAQFMERLTEAMRQMMFVSGETAEPCAETTGLIEDIVRGQVVEMVSRERPVSIYIALMKILSLHTPLNLPIDGAVAQSQLPISSSSSATTKPKSLASRPSSPGRMSARM
jgi:hypothetical protein